MLGTLLTQLSTLLANGLGLGRRDVATFDGFAQAAFTVLETVDLCLADALNAWARHFTHPSLGGERANQHSKYDQRAHHGPVIERFGYS